MIFRRELVQDGVEGFVAADPADVLAAGTGQRLRADGIAQELAEVLLNSAPALVIDGPLAPAPEPGEIIQHPLSEKPGQDLVETPHQAEFEPGQKGN